jgi:glycerate kinase
MNILIAADSFKDALGALDVCKAIEKGLLAAKPTLKTSCFPLADGGEGTTEILRFHSSGKMVWTKVHDPLGRIIDASFALSADHKTAFIEMASASGLPLLKMNERNPLLTSTFGTGELILAAIQAGAERIIIGIGGSATNDAGIGMAAALGFQFLDKDGEILAPIGKNLNHIHQISSEQVSIDLSKIQFDVLCDVDNPLYGPKGAAFVYAEQKGANNTMIQQLDEGLQNIAQVFQDTFGTDFRQIPGAGAAGGLGAGCMAFLNAQLKPGIQSILQITNFEQHIQNADLLITGEGKIDHQSLHGKLISGLTNLAKDHKVPVIALCGALFANPQEINNLGLKAAFSIQSSPKSLEEALKNTAQDLEWTAFHMAQLL